MKRPLFSVFFVGLLVLASIWGWRFFFPSPERAIRNRLAGLAAVASFSAHESDFARVYNSQKLAAFFTSDVEATVDVPGHSGQPFNGRDQVVQAAVMARSMVGSLKVEFVGLNVTVAPDKTSALVNLTAKATVPGEKDWVPQELNLSLRKVEGHWLINRVETVKPLL